MRADELNLPPTKSVPIVFPTTSSAAELVASSDTATAPLSSPSTRFTTEGSTMIDSRAAQYRRLIRWYPASWRARNEEAIVAVMMDEDDAKRRIAPIFSDRLALAAAGLQQRVIAPERLSGFALGCLIFTTLFSTWYLGVIVWAPGVTFAGTVGPFANPTVIVGGMFLVAFVLALVSRGRTARLVALLSVPVMVAIGILSSIYSWLGPGLPTVVIFTGLGMLAASPLRSVRDVARVCGAFALVLASITLTEFALALAIPFELSVLGGVEALSAVGALIGAILLLWPAAQKFRKPVSAR